MIPLYGFLQGDTIGLLVLAQEDDTMSVVTEKLKSAASVRVKPRVGGDLYFEGRRMDPLIPMGQSGIQALDRIDVRWEDEA